MDPDDTELMINRLRHKFLQREAADKTEQQKLKERETQINRILMEREKDEIAGMTRNQ